MNKKSKKSTNFSKSSKSHKSAKRNTPRPVGNMRPTKSSKTEFSKWESKIMAVLKKDMEHQFSSRELLRKTGIREKEEFYLAIHTLVENGHITNRNHVISFNKNSEEVIGNLVSLSKAFGFARPENGGDDIFIPGRFLKGAFIGDKILIGGIEKDEKGYSGKIYRIIEKSKVTTTGTINQTDYGMEVIPDNAIRYNPSISAGDLMGAKMGDKVLVKLVQDYRGDWTMAKVLRVFGTGDIARVCADAIIEQHGIPMMFSEEVLAEAEKIASQEITEKEISKRLDLREEAIFTIDGADAKDLDDAISVKKLENGYELGVHIADVAHYIRPKTLVDEEALNRGTSVYFADRVIPMLPECISNGVCSLNSGTDKLAFSAIMTLDESGSLKKYKFKKTIINSKVRGVYSEVNEILSGTASKELLEKYAPVMDSLLLANELADKLKIKSKARGTMEIESGESKFVLDENGICIDVVPRSQGISEGLIEQLMVTANNAAARFSVDNKIPFLYRVHENPEPQRIRDLRELLQALGIPCAPLLKEKPSPKDFADILDSVRGESAEILVSQRLLRTMEKAKYSVEPLGHFGLGLKDYSHFTSPIRRYPDTTIHRILTAMCEGESTGDIVKKYSAFADNSANQSSACEVRAVTAERDAEDCYMAEYIRAHIGEEYTGVVSGVTRNGVFVRLKNNVEGFVGTDKFTNNKFVFDGIVTQKCVNTGRTLTIGTELDIIVASAHVATGKIDFSPISLKRE